MSTKYARLRAFLNRQGEPDYRFRQITRAVFERRIGRFDAITTLPRPLRDALCAEFGPEVLSIRPVAASESPQAKKVLFELHDGHRIEAVAMRYKAGWESFCISSQSGCGLGCTFCATGAIGLKRNLTADEVTDQILHFYLEGSSIDSVALMGMGEALANPHTFDALEIFTDDALFDLSPRRLTLSTVGIVPAIRELTARFPQINLTFSLHSPFDAQRSELVPLNARYPIAEVMKALDEHIQKTRRRVFIAYWMLHGVTDTPAHADALAALLKGRGDWDYLYHVNLIRYNPAVGTPAAYERTDKDALAAFQGRLTGAGIHVTVRQSFGTDIDAACGQLYGRYAPA